MAYLTREDLDSVYGLQTVEQILDDGTGFPDLARLDVAVFTTQSIIDRHLRARYVVPFSSLPPEILDIAVEIAWYQLAMVNGQTPEDVSKRYDSAMKSLKEIANGSASLAPEIQKTTTAGSSQISVGTKTIVFNSSWLAKYEI